MSRPAESDEWWLAVLWAADAEGLLSFADLAPAGGPPPEPPAARIGMTLGGGLSPRGGPAPRPPRRANRHAPRRRSVRDDPRGCRAAPDPPRTRDPAPGSGAALAGAGDRPSRVPLGAGARRGAAPQRAGNGG